MAQSSRGNPAVGDILRTVVVLGLIVLGVWAFGRLFTETPDQPTSSVEFQVPARSAARAADFEVWVPSSLPDGWRATSARYTNAVGGRWHLGVVTDDEEYVGLDQTGQDLEKAIERVAEGATVDGEATIDGTTWQVFTAPGDELVYALSQDGTTTIVEATAERSDVERYVASLAPVS